MDIEYTVFDLEPQKHSKDIEDPWNNLDKFKLSCAVTWQQDDGYKHWFEDDVNDLIKYLQDAKVVVGFNIQRFDFGVLSGYTDFNFEKIPTFDILARIFSQLGHHIKLANLVEANLNEKRYGNMTKTTEWYKEGNVEKVRAYCENDVRITNALFRLALSQDKIKFFRWDIKTDIDTIDTSTWLQKFAELAGEPVPDTSNLKVNSLNKFYSIDLHLEMNDEENGSMTHEQEQCVVGMMNQIQQLCKTMNAVSPVKVAAMKVSQRDVFGKWDVKENNEKC